jgi:hypothetical protein
LTGRAEINTEGVPLRRAPWTPANQSRKKNAPPQAPFRCAALYLSVSLGRPAFSRFRAAHPDIQLDLIDGTAQSIEEQLIGAKRRLRFIAGQIGSGILASTICHCFGSR